MATDTSSPRPTCENCGRDKTPTYICDACIDRFNDHIRSTTAKLTAVLVHLRDESEAQCYCEFNRDGKRTLYCEHCEAYASAVRIAEGEV